MSDKTKELTIKTLSYITIILLLLLFPGSIFWVMLIPNEEIAMFVGYTILFLFFAIGGANAILMLIFGGIKQKPVKADKIGISFTSFEQYLTFLQDALPEKQYFLQKTASFSSDGQVILYIRSIKLWEIDCFTVIRVPELTDELLEIANDSITDILIEFYNGQDITAITDSVNMISVICVDRITPAFQKLVNTTAQQGFKNGRLPVGISFGGRNMYIANQKDGFAIAKYKRLRKEFNEIMGLNNK